MVNNTESVSDIQLISQTLNGNPHAFGLIYDRYLATIYNYVFFRVNNVQEAEDLTEAIFLKAYEFIHKKNPKIRNVRAWLFRIAHNKVIDFYRSDKFHTQINEEDLSNQGNTEQTAFERIQSVTLKSAINRLDPIPRDVIIHRFVNGLSHKETANILKLKANHVRVIQYRALLKIREMLEDDE